MQISYLKKQSIFISPFVFLILSCNPFAPSLSDDISNTSLILTEQRTPQEVMTNFAFAYNFKDSLVYSDLIDTTFLFISKDYSTDPVTDLTWGRDTELKATSGLFKKSQTLNLIWGGTIFEHEIDSTHVEMKQLFQLTLDIDFVLRTINSEALFILRRNSSGRWKITRWEDKAAF
ncbi:MAG: hypothetical protein D8M58_02400 [Calditrichaeota bacterium]|nr:MAG: hypothetical protein DWQ03_04680 [Calditrichota bacterium]MBL1204215.1 hypothetical protein [Calditrichota bacterium]NOG44045.1 hypothetical protein [Calditrichota bacterium]